MQTMTIGNSDLHVAPLGVGTWAWGDTRYWGYGQDHTRSDVDEAFRVSVEAGLTFFDTAEIYGGGASERILGELARQCETPVIIATKFMPWPYRLTARALSRALDASLQRLGVDHVDLYQIHWPFSLIRTETLMGALADAVEAGNVRYVGVSNYNATQMRRAHAALARRGVPLVSNQINYSLLNRSPEMNGVLDTCRELSVAIIAYSPLAQGILTGKYKPGSKAPGLRRFRRPFRRGSLEAVMPVVKLLREIGEAHGGKTPAQVALNWLVRQEGVIPIPGAKNARQAAENAGAIGWQITDDEAEALNQATLRWRSGS